LAAWLGDLGLERYLEACAANDIDAAVLRTLHSDDLRELGVVSLGHRKKLLEAIAALSPQTSAAHGADASAPPMVRQEPERRQLTVLFCDLVGSTEMAARLDPEDMSDVIRAYQEACAGVIGRFEGHVARLMGDSMLAYFGWPRGHEDDAERAVRAGLAAVEEVGRLSVGAGVGLAARVGIATGLVVGALVGQGAAQEEAVVGETPNLAARLQQLAAPGQVVIAASTRQLLGELFELHPLPPRPSKASGRPCMRSRWRRSA
jgi:class 3 adenylate cyclase